MTKAKAKPAKAKVVAAEATATAQANARARGPDVEVFSEWCRRIASGKTERFAAIGLGVAYGTIRYWAADHAPCELCDGAGCPGCEGKGKVKGPLGTMLEEAHESHIQSLIDAPTTAAMALGTSEDDGLHPEAAKIIERNARWMLPKLSWERFGERTRVDSTLAGPDGGPVKSEVAVSGIIRVPRSELRKADG